MYTLVMEFRFAQNTNMNNGVDFREVSSEHNVFVVVFKYERERHVSTLCYVQRSDVT